MSEQELLEAADVRDFVARELVCPGCGSEGSWTAVGERLCCECGGQAGFQGKLLEFAETDFSHAYGSLFKEAAENYEELHSLGEGFSLNVTRPVRRVLEQYFELPVAGALEVGCGTGVMTRGYQHHGIARSILASDISREMLVQALGADRSESTLYFVMDAHDVPFRDGAFDVVLGGAILHHLTGVESCLREFSRVLRDGGVAVFQEPFYYGNQFLVFMVRAVLERLASEHPDEREAMDELSRTVDSYAGNIAMRHRDRARPERLAHLDDKHLFIKDELSALARRAGFAEVAFDAPWCVDSPGQPERGLKVWQAITIEIIEALKKEAGLEGRLELDYSRVAFLESFDETIGNDLLRLISPQEIVVFRK